MQITSDTLSAQRVNGGDYEHIRIFARRYHYTVTVHRPDDHRVDVGEGPHRAHFYWRNQSHYDVLIPMPAEPVPLHPVPAAKRKRMRQPEVTQTKK